jgi:hypothetical protein
MTDLRTRLSIVTSVVLIALALGPARADEGSDATRGADPVARLRTAANIDVPAPRLTKAPTVSAHHRKVGLAARPAVAPARPIRIAYRPAAETACGSNPCRVPIVLFIGITY